MWIDIFECKEPLKEFQLCSLDYVLSTQIPISPFVVIVVSLK